tara:strand:- start:416 stop:1105 length:690 start_codon:yes stop_codon:yes gene_type:complete
MVVVAVLWFAACLLLINALYAPVERLLRQQYVGRFDALSANARAYCVKNVLKSIVLAGSLPASLYVVQHRIVKGEMIHAELARGVGSLYAANDVVALCRVRLPPNTRLHHLVVLALALYNLGVDYDDSDSIFSNLVVLCGLSIIPFTVNSYLGLRRLDERTAGALARIALVSYLPAVLLNAAWQTRAVWRAMAAGEHRDAALWAGLCAAIFADDAILISYMWHAAARRA